MDGQKRLKDLMHVDDARIIIQNKDGKFIFFNDSNDLQEVTELVGYTKVIFNKGKIDVTLNNQNDDNFNQNIDLDTSMPVIYFPIKSVKQPEQTLGVVQVTYLKAISGIFD